MPKDFRIKCLTIPPGETGPLILRMEPEVGILSLHITWVRPCPKGINIDGMIMFDMQADGGLDQIEILYRVKTQIEPGVILPSPSERYWRLLLFPSHDSITEPDVTVEVIDNSNELKFLIRRDDIDSSFLIGPSTRALVRKKELVGISIDLAGLSR